MKLDEFTEKYGNDKIWDLNGLEMINLLDDAITRIKKWETELSAVMPMDFKDWFQGNKAEWPEIAAMVIRNLQTELEEAEWISDSLWEANMDRE